MKTILLDLGGVLTLDPWESICLTPRRGLGSRLGVPVEIMYGVGATLWSGFATRKRHEDEYWTDFSERIGVAIPQDLVDEVSQETLLINPWAKDLIKISADLTSGRVGIISDNTDFFFARQASLLGLDTWVDPELVFLSHVAGLRKSERSHGLFEHAADCLDAASTLILDDRLSNIERAQGLGFSTRLVGPGPVDYSSLLD